MLVAVVLIVGSRGPKYLACIGVHLLFVMFLHLIMFLRGSQCYSMPKWYKQEAGCYLAVGFHLLMPFSEGTVPC